MDMCMCVSQMLHFNNFKVTSVAWSLIYSHCCATTTTTISRRFPSSPTQTPRPLGTDSSLPSPQPVVFTVLSVSVNLTTVSTSCECLYSVCSSVLAYFTEHVSNFIHVVACVTVSFLFCDWRVVHGLRIHSAVDGHLGCFSSNSFGIKIFSESPLSTWVSGRKCLCGLYAVRRSQVWLIGALALLVRLPGSVTRNCNYLSGMAGPYWNLLGTFSSVTSSSSFQVALVSGVGHTSQLCWVEFVFDSVTFLQLVPYINPWRYDERALSWPDIGSLAILHFSIFTLWGFVSFLKTLFWGRSTNFLSCSSIWIRLFLQNGIYVGVFESCWMIQEKGQRYLIFLQGVGKAGFWEL